MSTKEIDVTIQSGRFFITKVNSEIMDDDDDDIEIFDDFMLKLFDVIRRARLEGYDDENVPFHFVFDPNGTLESVKLTDNNKFNELFGSKINIIKSFNSCVKISCNNQHLNYMMEIVDDKNLLKHEVMKLLGGNLFPMFPECVGYIYNLYYSSLLQFKPHEYLYIDENCLLKYFRYKLNKNI